ncbi:hypothetical protein M3Y99_00957000 [Aphelenchoides fujianensis]|nr:hypothetical protein M3Y99_00957000 [Aphelenchoides fujianensis]
MGQMTDSVRSMVDENPTSTLLHEFTEVNVATAARTARTPADTVDTIAMAADDLLALTTAETPLKGGLNTPLHSTEFSTNLDRSKHVAATPNTVLPSVLGTPRTSMGNSENYLETPGSQRQGGCHRRAGRADGRQAEQTAEAAQRLRVGAARGRGGERDGHRASWKNVGLAKERRLRTQVFQRDLPIPSKVNDQYDKKSAANTEQTRADDLVKSEMVKLMEWDMSEARKLIEAEMEQPPPLDAKMWTVLRECSSELIRYQGRYTRLSNLGRREQAEALANKFRARYEWMNELAKKANKVEKKLQVKLGGYISIQNNLQTKLRECLKEREKLLTELKTFRRLEQNEERAMVKRVEVLMKELREVQECQDELQKQYAELQREHCALMSTNNH